MREFRLDIIEAAAERIGQFLTLEPRASFYHRDLLRGFAVSVVTCARHRMYIPSFNMSLRLGTEAKPTT